METPQAAIVITPTIGRRVWYWPSASDTSPTQSHPMTVLTGDQACDAGIAFVWGDRMVNLTVADHCGRMHERNSVPLVQEGDAMPAAGFAYATWMPYQTKQAKA